MWMFFFKGITCVEEKLDSFERIFQTNRRWIPRFFTLCVVLSGVLLAIKKETASLIVFLAGVIFFLVDGVIGWRHSTQQWLKVGIVYNFYFSFFMAALLYVIFGKSIVIPVFLVLYSLVWILLSLLTNSKVSLIVNEVMSGITTTIFTIVTYIVSIKMEELSKTVDYTFSRETLEQAIKNNNKEYLYLTGLELLKYCFILLLPVIGTTAMSIVLIKIKDYWKEKRQLGRSFEEIQESKFQLREFIENTSESTDVASVNVWLGKRITYTEQCRTYETIDTNESRVRIEWNNYGEEFPYYSQYTNRHQCFYCYGKTLVINGVDRDDKEIRIEIKKL